MSISPLQYTVLLKDDNGNLITQIQNKIKLLSWEWDRMGGCGGCNITIKDAWDGSLATTFSEDYEINIYAPDLTGTSALWYSGYVDSVKPIVKGSDEYIEVFCLGYINQLKRVAIENKTYSTKECSEIVKDMVEVYGTGITDITSTASDYEDTLFVADNVYFNESCFEAVNKIANISGRREWGVRADKSFFFKTRDDSIKHIFNIIEDFTSFTSSRDYNPIITSIYLQGGEEYSGYFTIINKKTIREEIISNSSIITQSVGQQFARMYLKDKGIAKRSYTGTLVNKNKRYEETIPIGKATVNKKVGIKDYYDIVTNFYDSGIKYDGGTESYQIEKIKYEMADDDINITFYFGVIPPNIADELAQLEYLINTERNK